MVTRRRVAIATAALAVIAVLVWQLPSRGADCGDLADCRSSVALDLDELPGAADDWAAVDEGVTLSPDETEAAVVLWNPERGEHRLAVFSTETGERRGSFEVGEANFFANPVYSTDGSELAAAVGTRQGETVGAGSVVVWDRSSFEVNHELWSWNDDDNDNDDLTATIWGDCVLRPFGFSNDGDYLYCNITAQHVETGEERSAFDYAPGFNTLPSTTGRYVVERIVYDPDVSRGTAAQLDRDAAAVSVDARDGSPTRRIELGTGWREQAIALDGPAERTMITRTARVTGLARLLPPVVRPAGNVTIVDNTADTVLVSHDVNGTPRAIRFSPSGAGYVVLTNDRQLMVFDTP